MEFHTKEELDEVARCLAQSEFEWGRLECGESSAQLTLYTSRPLGELSPAGLFRKSRTAWVPCRLIFRHVRSLRFQTQSPSSLSKEAIRIKAGCADTVQGTQVELILADDLRLEVEIDPPDGSLDDV
jgi:hypothetical protein